MQMRLIALCLMAAGAAAGQTYAAGAAESGYSISQACGTSWLRRVDCKEEKSKKGDITT